MNVNDLLEVALACGTAAGIFIALAFAAAAMVYQTVEASSADTRRAAFELSERIATLVSSIGGGYLRLLPDEMEPRVLGDLASAFATANFKTRTFDGHEMHEHLDPSIKRFKAGESALANAEREIQQRIINPVGNALQQEFERERDLDTLRGYRELGVLLIPVRASLDAATHQIDHYRAQQALWIDTVHALKKSAFTGWLVAFAFVVAGASSTVSVVFVESANVNLVVGWTLIFLTAGAFAYSGMWIRRVARDHLLPSP